MECVNSNCNISGDDRMVSCWLCLGTCHLKCCGLKARDADALNDKSKHLQWTCPKCRIVDTEFYNFFKSYKSEYEAIRNDFLVLKEKFDSYGELFSKFTNLDKFSTSPKYNRNTSKQSSSPPGNSKAGIEPKKINNSSSRNDQAIPVSVAADRPEKSSESTISISNSLNSLNQLQLNIPSTPQFISNRPTNNLSPELMVFSPSVPTNSAPMDIPASNQNVNQSLSAAKPKPLIVIPPMKTIFVSRFAADTSVPDVEYYIRNNLDKCSYNNIQIYKISARSRASFKIIVPDILFDRLVNVNFWPRNTIVRQFVYKNNDNVTLPSAAVVTPKN